MTDEKLPQMLSVTKESFGSASLTSSSVLLLMRAGTRFRPLSFNLPKPLFPLAGQPMVHHPVNSCKKIPNLAHIYLIGFYEERDFSQYCSSISSELKIPVRYLQEDRPHGSAGGLYSFRDTILEDCPEDIIVLNCDVWCSFPLREMLEAHNSMGGIGTLLVKKVSADYASHFGELVADLKTKELLHFAEKPETFARIYLQNILFPV